jgi:hypothetical protein
MLSLFEFIWSPPIVPGRIRALSNILAGELEYLISAIRDKEFAK